MKDIELIKGDCLEEYKQIKNSSIDLILADPPYGNIKGLSLPGWKDKTTAWDVIIDPKDLMEIANKKLRQNGKMILFAQGQYVADLINGQNSNINYLYSLIWEKNDFANKLLAKKAPVSYFEIIVVFGKKYDSQNENPLRVYFGQLLEYIELSRSEINKKMGNRQAEHCFYVKAKIKKEVKGADHYFRRNSLQFELCTEKTYNRLIELFKINKMKGFKPYKEIEEINKKGKSIFNLWGGREHKSNILRYKKDVPSIHPTQKPVGLLEDLIKTYTNENDLVLDVTMGSGSTGIACRNTKRRFIGIEKDEKYFGIAKRRIEGYVIVPQFYFWKM